MISNHVQSSTAERPGNSVDQSDLSVPACDENDPSKSPKSQPQDDNVPVDFDHGEAHKTTEIIAACRSKDVSRLRSLADSQGGLLNDTLRRAAWPILLGLLPPLQSAGHDVDRTNTPIPLPHPAAAGTTADDDSDDGKWKDLPRHRDEEQVHLDVNRSFIYYPNDQSDEELKQRKAELASLIIQVLRRYPYLCYFQGYHDICQVFLLVLGRPNPAATLVARLSVLRIRDFMLPTLAPTTAQLRLLPEILARADPALRRHLAGVEPFYALAGTLTMYAHNIECYHDIARLFDVFLAREPVFSIYMFAQIVIDRRDEIFAFDEPDMLHVILGKVPAKMNFDDLLASSVALFERCPPHSLRAWRHISSASALKTARDSNTDSGQTMEEGHIYFEQQANELRWAELQDRVKTTLWVYRRPVKTVGMAVAVAAVAFYLRRNPNLMHAILAFFSR